MSIQGPAELEVECDCCGVTQVLSTTEYAGGLPTWGISKETLREAGWEEDGGETYCPECAEGTEEE